MDIIKWSVSVKNEVFANGRVKRDDSAGNYTSVLGLIGSIKQAWGLIRISPPHRQIHTPSVSLNSWLAPNSQIKNRPRIPQKTDTKMQSTQVSWQIVWEGDFLKHPSSFQMLHDQKHLSGQHGGNRGWLVLVTLRQCCIGKILARHLQQLLPGSTPANQKWGRHPLLASGQRRLLVRRRPSRKRGKPTNRDLLYFPSSFRPASGALVVFLLFCLILSLSSLWTIEATMVLSKWFHRLLFRHSTFNISILSFCFHTKGALLQYNVLRIMSMSSNGF